MNDTRYVFKFDDFTENFRKNFEEFIRFHPEQRWDVLEIGVLDGRNAIWLLENVLKHPHSTYIGIDKWLQDQASANINFFIDKATLIKADSKQAMRWINKKFNLIYIDSEHVAPQCICESALAWSMLKPQGILVWDDYGNHHHPGVKLAVDNFLECFEEGKDYKLLFKNWQVGVKILQSS